MQPPAAPTQSSLVVRINNTEALRATANTWATYDALAAEINMRMDADVFFNQDDTIQIRAIVAAYRDIDKVTWKSGGALNQSRDYEFGQLFTSVLDAPFGDPFFDQRILQAHVAQTMYVLNGTQVRDMAAQGIRLSRSMTGVDMEFTGYRGPVCTEAMEILSPYIETAPRMKRMG